MANDPQEQLDNLTESFGKLTGELKDTSNAGQEVIKSLLALAEQAKKTDTAEKKLMDEQAKQEAKRKKAVDDLSTGIQGMVGSALAFTIGMVNVSSSIASSDKAFTAVTPVIDAVGIAMKGFITALGTGMSGMSAFGFGAGELPKGIAIAVNTGIDLILGSVKQQLENTQRLFDSFDHISKVGVTFGGNLYALRDAAHEAGIGIDTYAKIASKNAAIMAELGGSIEEGTSKVVKFGRDLAKSDRTLLAVYGNYENLNTAIAEYASLQTKYGVAGAQLNRDMESSARAYLYQQKELADLTGKSVDQLKKEAEERAKSAAYQVALSKMTADERLNAEYMMTQMRAKYGEAGEKYAMEYISNNGKTFSKTALQFEALVPELRKVTGDMAGNLKEGTDKFKQSTNDIITANADAIEARVKSSQFEKFYQIDQAGYNNEVIKQVTSFGSAVLQTTQAQKEASKAGKTIADNNKKANKSAVEEYAAAIDSLEGFKTKIDDITLKHLDATASYLELAYGAAEKFAKNLDYVNEFLQIMLEKDPKKQQEMLKKLFQVVDDNKPKPSDMTPHERRFQRQIDAQLKTQATKELTAEGKDPTLKEISERVEKLRTDQAQQIKDKKGHYDPKTGAFVLEAPPPAPPPKPDKADDAKSKEPPAAPKEKKVPGAATPEKPKEEKKEPAPAPKPAEPKEKKAPAAEAKPAEPKDKPESDLKEKLRIFQGEQKEANKDKTEPTPPPESRDDKKQAVEADKKPKEKAEITELTDAVKSLRSPDNPEIILLTDLSSSMKEIVTLAKDQRDIQEQLLRNSF